MVIASFDRGERPDAATRGGAVTIGNFDGVHRGHVSLLGQLRQEADRIGGPAVVLTFDPHPLQVLRPDLFQPLLTTVQYRAHLLCSHGADHVLILRTTPELLQLRAREFFQQVIQEHLAAAVLVEGVNFRFGRGREGTVDRLQALCRQAGVKLVVAAPFPWHGEMVASSRVRAALAAGNARQAAELLGRPYRLYGVVGTGQRRGQLLGFPTANLERVETLIPADGVYAVQVTHRDRVWPAAANIGGNPTFGEHVRKVEVHLIGFTGELTGETLAVDFIDHLRATRPFAGPQQLVEQLHQDIERARQLAAPEAKG